MVLYIIWIMYLCGNQCGDKKAKLLSGKDTDKHKSIVFM